MDLGKEIEKKEDIMAITIEQSHQIMAILANNTDWKRVSFEFSGLEESIFREPKGAGRRFTDFLRNGGRFIFAEFPKPIPTVKTDFHRGFCAGMQEQKAYMGIRTDIWKGPVGGRGLKDEEDRDMRSDSFAEVDISKMIFEPFPPDQGSALIRGEDMLRYLRERPDLIRLGANAFIGFWRDYELHREKCVLEWLYRVFGVECLDFYGLVVFNRHKNRLILRLARVYNDETLELGWWAKDFFPLSYRLDFYSFPAVIKI